MVMVESEGKADLGPQMSDRGLGQPPQMPMTTVLASAPNLDPMQCLIKGLARCKIGGDLPKTMEDRNKILGGSQWCWEDNNPLMLKPWHPTFNPEVKSLASWWKDVPPQSYTVEKVAGILKSHQDVEGLINDSIAKIPDISNDGQDLASGLVGEGVFPKGCRSFQDSIGGIQLMEDGPSSQRGLNAGMDEGNQSKNHC
ncbi:hypothetical protein SUGI_0704560 [Cryptomeria japonica]|nr:hypothetical protein SUGI_0704560 [Cryptomeria japonica]